MKRDVIYFIDEDPAARRANARALTSLLDNQDIKIVEQEPFSDIANYAKLLASPGTAAFVLDQRMKGSGQVTYNGTDLAKYLRAIDGKMPIYILTGHADDIEDFRGSNHLVEYIIGKDEIDDASSEKAKTVKARMLRHLDVFNDVRDEQEQRFHDLLVKSLQKELTSDEQSEMDRIQGDNTAAILAAEREQERELNMQVAALRKLLQPN
jgi:DNA-binding NarL/FixJ family response regulator